VSPARPALHEEPLTEEQLRLALRHLQRPHWPTTLDAVLAHPTYGPCVRGLARQLQRQRPCLPTISVRRGPPVPPTQTAPRPVNKQPRFDARKAAANDFD
jgi:hypothetical protein